MFKQTLQHLHPQGIFFVIGHHDQEVITPINKAIDLLRQTNVDEVVCPPSIKEHKHLMSLDVPRNLHHLWRRDSY